MDTELLDERAIRAVILTYCRGVDRMDRGLVRSCYHDDALEEHGSFRGTVDEYIEWVWKVLARYDRTSHMVANQLIELRGNRAHCETYGVAFHEGDPTDPTRNLTVGFRYLDRFERRPDHGWKIVERVAVTDWCRSFAPETRWDIPEHLLVGRRGSADPLYDSRAWLDG